MSDSRKGSLLVVFLTVFIDLLGFGMVIPLLPIYAKDFAAQMGLEEGHVRVGIVIGLLMASFSAMQFLFAPVWGRLSDRIGRRPVLMIGLAGSVVFYTLFGIATVLKSLTLLFVARVGAGVAGATISTAHAYIADVTSKKNRTRGMALIGAAFGLGFTFGPLFGYLAVPSGRRDPGPGPGYAAAGLSAIALALAYFKLPESLGPNSQAARRHWFDRQALREALATPAVGVLLLAMFICVFSFANLESTLSLILSSERMGFEFTFGQVCLTFAFIGFTLAIVQGGLVRPLASRISEAVLASVGTLIEIGGFIVLAQAARSHSLPMILGGLAVVVTGFAFMTPSLNSLLSRWSDPTKQGGILGIGQSISSLARILGPMAGIPLVENRALADRLGVTSAQMPLFLATAMMTVGLGLILLAASRGRDFETPPEPASPEA
ncbi:MAG: MFS transporter [Planctomycetota bacterium]|nr:MAG: MFS transporter [Planctomycetota bacterium]